MDGAIEFLKLVRPLTWPEIYDKTKKVAQDIRDLGWPQRSQALSEELIQLVQEPFGPRGMTDQSEASASAALSSIAEESALTGKILVTAVLLQIDEGDGCDVGVPSTVEHALTLTLSLVPAWGDAAQSLLERRDEECDAVLTTLPGYMLTMLADDFGKPSTRSDRVRAVWTRGLLAGYRNGPFSLAVH